MHASSPMNYVSRLAYRPMLISFFFLFFLFFLSFYLFIHNLVVFENTIYHIISFLLKGILFHNNITSTNFAFPSSIVSKLPNFIRNRWNEISMNRNLDSRNIIVKNYCEIINRSNSRFYHEIFFWEYISISHDCFHFHLHEVERCIKMVQLLTVSCIDSLSIAPYWKLSI